MLDLVNTHASWWSWITWHVDIHLRKFCSYWCRVDIYTFHEPINHNICSVHQTRGKCKKGVLNSTFFLIWLVFNQAFIESGQGWSVSLSRGLLEVDIESQCLQILPFVYFLDKGHCQGSLSFWHGHGFKYSFLCLPCVLNVGAVLQIQNQIGLDVISLLLSH